MTEQRHDRSLIARQLLDPNDGYPALRAPDDLRVDQRRVELGALIMFVHTMVEMAVATMRHSLILWLLIGIASVGSASFWLRARRVQRRPTDHLPWLVEGFVIFALLVASCAGWISGTEGRVSIGYPLIVMAAAAFYMIRVRRFVAIAAATYAFYGAWMLSLDLPFLDRLFALINTGMAVIAACFARAAINRMQQVGRLQRQRIAEQNDALQAANLTLTRRNEELNELMAVAAHDLRSPLLGLRSVLDLVRERPPSTPQGFAPMLDAARQSVSGMVALVSRLLDVHEVEGRSPPTPSTVNLGLLLAAAVQRMAPFARGAGVLIERDVPRDAVIASGNPHAIEQVLDNLLSNAIRYSPANSVVRVSAGTMEDGAFVEVADNGVGVPEAERVLLFAKFRRGSTPPHHGQRGSGLGLYIVAVLTRQMEATCSYRPNEEGGSIFHVSFRKSVNSHPALPKYPAGAVKATGGVG